MPLFNQTTGSVAAGDTSIVVGGTTAAPTIETATLDVIAADHPPAANWSNNSHKITSLANGSASTDAAAYGQIVTGVTATDTSVVVTGTSAAPTVATGTLDVIATQHAPAADWSNNSHKITSLANGSASTDAAAFGQLPSGSSPLAIGSGGTGQTSASAALTALGALPLAGGTMSGAIAMGSSKITGLTNGSSAQDVAAFGQIPVADTTAANIQPLGTTAAGGNGKWADSGHVHPAGSGWTPADSSWLAWNYDPHLAGTNGAVTNNTIYVCRVNIRQAMSITNVVLYLEVVGSSLTTSQNWAGLYNSSGTLIAATADQTTNWAASAASYHTMALTGAGGPPYAVSAGFVWVAFVSNGSGTPPAFSYALNNQAAQANSGMTASTARWGTIGTGTSLSTITPSSITLASKEWWCAVS